MLLVCIKKEPSLFVIEAFEEFLKMTLAPAMGSSISLRTLPRILFCCAMLKYVQSMASTQAVNFMLHVLMLTDIAYD